MTPKRQKIKKITTLFYSNRGGIMYIKWSYFFKFPVFNAFFSRTAILAKFYITYFQLTVVNKKTISSQEGDLQVKSLENEMFLELNST